MNLENSNDGQASSNKQDINESKEFWWNESALEPKDLLLKSGNWTLGADAATATVLKSISEKLIQKTQEIEKAISQVEDDSKKVFTSLLNTNNSFLLLSNTQFIENRTYQDDDSLQEEDIPAPNKPEPTVEDILSSYNRAIYAGIELVNDSLEKYEISDSESDSESPSRPLTVYKRIEPYTSRRLPHIIGSEAFLNDDSLGLADPAENDNVVCNLASSESEHEKEKMKANSVQIIKGISSNTQDGDSDDSDLSIEQNGNSSNLSNFSSALPTLSAVFGGQGLGCPVDVNKKDSFSFNRILSESEEEGDLLFCSSSAAGSSKNVATPISGKKVYFPILNEEIPPLPEIKIEEELKKDHRASHFKKEKDKSRNLVVVDSESDDEDSLFSSRVGQSSVANNKFISRESSSYRKAKPNRRSKKKIILGSSSSSADESVSPVGREDKLSEPISTNYEDSTYAEKKPVGGINIFSSAVTKAIQSQKQNDSVNHSTSSSSEKNVSSNQINRKKSKDDVGVEQSKKTLISRSITTPSTKAKVPSSHATAHSNETKPVRHNSLFSDEEDLFSPIPAAKNQQVSSQNPVSLFDDSDDDLFGAPSTNREIFNSKPLTVQSEVSKVTQQPKSAYSHSSDKDEKLNKYSVRTKIVETASAVKSQQVCKNIFDSSSDEDYFRPPPLPKTDHAVLDKNESDKKSSGTESFIDYDINVSPPLPQEKHKARSSNDFIYSKVINNEAKDLSTPSSTKRVDKLTNDSSLCNEREESLDTKGRDVPNDNIHKVPSKGSQKIIDSIFSSDEDNIFNVPEPKINIESNKFLNNEKQLIDKSPNVPSTVHPKHVSNIASNSQDGESLTKVNNLSLAASKNASQSIFDDDSDEDIFASVYTIKSQCLSKSKKEVDSQQKCEALLEKTSSAAKVIPVKSTVDKLMNSSPSYRSNVHPQVESQNSNLSDSQRNRPTSLSNALKKIPSLDFDDSDDEDIFSSKSKEPVSGTMTSLQNSSVLIDSLPKECSPEKSNSNSKEISNLFGDISTASDLHSKLLNNSVFDDGLVSDQVKKLNDHKSKDELSSTTVSPYQEKNEESVMPSESNSNSTFIDKMSKNNLEPNNDTTAVYSDKHRKLKPIHNAAASKPQAPKIDDHFTLKVNGTNTLDKSPLDMPTNSVDTKTVSLCSSNTNLTDGDSPTRKSPKKPIGGVALAGGSELIAKLEQRRGKENIIDPVFTTYDTEPKIEASKERTAPMNNSSSNLVSTVKTTYIISSNRVNTSQINSHKEDSEPKVISAEIGSSFEDLPTSRQVLKSINKERPRIQQRRNPPSRAKRKENIPTSQEGYEIVKSQEVSEIIQSQEVSNIILEKHAPDLSSTKLDSDLSHCSNLKNKSTISDIFGNDSDDEDYLFASNTHVKERLKQSSNVLGKIVKPSRPTSPLSAVKQTPKNLTSTPSNEIFSQKSKAAANTSPSHVGEEIVKHNLIKATFKDSKSQLNATKSSYGSSGVKPVFPTTNLFDDEDDDLLFGGSAAINVKVTKVEAPKFCSSTRSNRKKISLFSDEEDVEDPISDALKKPVEHQSNKELKLKPTLSSNVKKPSLFSDDESEDLFSTSSTLPRPRVSSGNSHSKKTDDQLSKKCLDFKDPLMGDNF